VIGLRVDPGWCDLGDIQDKAVFIVLNEIPRIPGQFALNISVNPGGTVNVDCFVPAETYTQQTIKSDKMVDMGMGYEDVGYFQNVAAVQGLDVPDIE